MTYYRTAEEAAASWRQWTTPEAWAQRPLALRSPQEQRDYWIAQGNPRGPVWMAGQGREPDLRPGWEARDLMNTPEYEESERRKASEELKKAGL